MGTKRLVTPVRKKLVPPLTGSNFKFVFFPQDSDHEKCHVTQSICEENEIKQ